MKYLLSKHKESNTLKYLYFVLVLVIILVFGIREFSHYKTMQQKDATIYGIDPLSGLVVKLDRKEYTYEDRILEYENHTKMFLTHFYGFDQYCFLDNMDFCKYLMSTEDFEEELNIYRTQNIFEIIQAEDIILHAKIENLKVEYINNIPTGTFQLIQSSRNPNISIVNKRVIEGTFKIRDIQARSSKITHACVIYDYVITRLETLK